MRKPVDPRIKDLRRIISVSKVGLRRCLALTADPTVNDPEWIAEQIFHLGSWMQTEADELIRAEQVKAAAAYALKQAASVPAGE